MSVPIDDGGPAFARPSGPPQKEINTAAHTGMSLRDWFAGQALAPLIAAAITSDAQPGKTKIARDCYDIADAMIAARKEQP